MTMINQEKAKVRIEEIKVKGGQLVDKVREIIEEGNARRVSIKKDDRVLLEFPLSVGVGGAVAGLWLAAPLVAVGAIAALVTEVKIVIEKVVDEVEDAEHSDAAAPEDDPAV